MSLHYRLVENPAVAVHPLALACCSLELAAAVGGGILRPPQADDPAPARHVLLIAGTVTGPMVAAVEAAWAALPEPRTAVAFGACASSGGPYWDAPSVSTVPADAFVPGGPPRPQALAAALAGDRR